MKVLTNKAALNGIAPSFRFIIASFWCLLMFPNMSLCKDSYLSFVSTIYFSDYHRSAIQPNNIFFFFLRMFYCFVYGHRLCRLKGNWRWTYIQIWDAGKAKVRSPCFFFFFYYCFFYLDKLREWKCHQEAWGGLCDEVIRPKLPILSISTQVFEWYWRALLPLSENFLPLNSSHDN